MLQSRFPSGRSRRGFIPLPSPTSRPPAFLELMVPPSSFKVCSIPSSCSLILVSALTSSLFHQATCDYIRPTQRIQDKSPHLQILNLITPTNFLLPCKARCPQVLGTRTRISLRGHYLAYYYCQHIIPYATKISLKNKGK